jgi:DNA-binding response OmpR family regulator
MKRKILIVDDDDDFIGLLRKRLEASGYEVFSAANGREGVELLEREKPDLAVIDLVMPVMDGYSMIKEMKRRQGSAIVPIVVLTARVEMKDLLALEGVGDYLVKPCLAEELLNRIQWNLRGK